MQDLITENDRVVARVVWSGIHCNTFRDLPATGKTVSINPFIVERVKDGKAVEHWSLFDQVSMMQQLGLLPS